MVKYSLINSQEKDNFKIIDRLLNLFIYFYKKVKKRCVLNKKSFEVYPDEGEYTIEFKDFTNYMILNRHQKENIKNILIHILKDTDVS